VINTGFLKYCQLQRSAKMYQLYKLIGGLWSFFCF
jgi:hypothetical protein